MKPSIQEKMIIITGASGFIGSCVLRYLNDKGYSSFLLVDDLKNCKWKNLVGKKFIDIIPKEELFKFLEGRENEIEAIIHLGACSSTICSDENYLFENNYRFSKKLAEYAVPNNIRFIYASSAATYGNGDQGFVDDENNLEKLKPINMYAYSKHLFDLWAKRNGYLDKIVGLKYFNVFGPNEYHKGPMASMILKMLTKIKKDGSISLFESNDLKNFKNGEQKRDFIYVKDAAYMTALLLEKPYNDVCGIFNIGTGNASTWNELALALFKSLNMKPNIEYVPMPNELVGQYQNYTQADMTKYKKTFKSLKLTNIQDAVKDYVQNYLLIDKRW
ncbi:MAG: ADP-glyceromanno-heptose 6-epimerase [Parachlamydiales bacterium]|jgi:ADP-L-glycero-D-manno-heptose 6-epimerase